MKPNKRHYIISGRHKRLQRLWQFFFTGWGLVIVAALAAAPFFTRSLLWTPITAVDVAGIAANQFKMENASFSGIDKTGNPFTLYADHARQEHRHPDKIFMTGVSGTIIRDQDGQSITDKISADRAEFERNLHRVTLFDNVKIDSSNGDRVRTGKMVIKL